MNPVIAKQWETSLKAFNAAKTAFENSESDSEVKKELRMAIVYGQFMTRELGQGGEESLIAAGTALENFSQFNRLGTRQAINITLKALKECHNLAPKEYNLPPPPLTDGI